jgi:hypothetical protein
VLDDPDPRPSTAPDPVDVAAVDSLEPPRASRPDRARRRRTLVALAAVAVLTVAAAAIVDGRRGGPSGPPAPPPGSWTLVPHQGLGAWIDVYDWTAEFTGGAPSVGVEDIDEMAELGIQTLYVQTGHRRAADDVIEPTRLASLIDRAHANDLHVVAWYLPSLVDLDEDLRRLTAAAALPVDGLGVDIEAVEVDDPVERTRRLLELTDRLRTEVGDDKAIAAVTLSAVHLEVVNPAFWPGYPWVELAEAYDAILPMAYWSIRRGDLREGGRYIGENIDRIRALTGDPDVPIHPIGGIADGISPADLDAMRTAITDRGAMGGSLYDWATSTPEQWTALRPLADLRVPPPD